MNTIQKIIVNLLRRLRKFKTAAHEIDNLTKRLIKENESWIDAAKR